MDAWTRSPWTDAGQIVAFIDPDGLPGESAGRPPAEWYRRLIAANDMSGAIEFLALALPRYDCIVWVAQALLETGAVDRHDAMMTTVLRWIDNPQDDLRRRAQAEAIAERRTNAAKLLALAIAYSGGSVAPPDLPPVNVPPESCAKMASTALIVGAYSLPDPQAAIRKSLDIGEKIVATQ